VSRSDTAEPPDDLSDDVRRNMPPFDPTLPCVRQGDSRVEMRSCDRAEGASFGKVAEITGLEKAAAQ